jgi:hypothetical protein
MTKSTLTITNPSRSGLAFEGDEGFETAAILAPTSQLGITAMGAFPLSLIALGQNSRWHFDETLTLRPKRTMNATEELESPQKVKITALTEHRRNMITIVGLFEDSEKMERPVEQFAAVGLNNSVYDESTTAADHGQVGEIRPAVS